MAGMSIGGLSSGLDTATIVDQLIAVESNPKVLLTQKKAKQAAVITALQGLNTRLASLATSAAALAKPTAFTTPAATSSSASVTVATTAGAGTGTLTFDVTQLAQRASWTSDVLTDTGADRAVVISHPSGQPVLVSAQGRTPADLADAINAADAGVVATVVRTGTDAGGQAQFRLLVTSTGSGAAGDFAMDVDGAPAARLATGQDARISLGAGVEVTSASNTFTGLLSGVDATVTKLETGVTLTSAPDGKAVAKQAAAVVGSLGVVLSEIASQTRATVGSAGPLVGSSLLRGIQQQLVAAVSSAVPGASLADLGVQLTRDGTVTLDESAFSAYAVREPDKARALTAAFAGALASAATQASATGSGTVSAAITSGQSSVRDLDTRITAWDDRLALRRTTLERQFAALELALQRSQSTSSYLTGALASLPGYSTSS